MASNSLAWFQNIFNDIQGDVMVVSKFKELKVALTGLHSSQVCQLSNSLQLRVLFDALNSFDKKQIELCSDVLKAFLSSLPSGTVFQLYDSELARSLGHAEKCVKEVILHELVRGGDDPELSRLVARKPSILEDSLTLLCGEDLSLAETASRLLVKIGLCEFGFQALTSPQSLSHIVNCLNQLSAVQSLRMYQVLMEIGAQSESKLTRLEEAGVLQGLTSLVTSEDVLARMAAVEELSKLAATRHAYKHSSVQNCVTILSKQISTSSDSPDAFLIYPGLMKFFGSICRHHAETVYKQHPEVFKAVVAACDSDDPVVATIAMETIGFVAATYHGKLALTHLGDQCLKNIVEKMQEVVSKGQVEWKVRVLYAVANLIHAEGDGVMRAGCNDLTEGWFRWLSGGLACFLDLSRSPFPEVKLAALQVIKELSSLPWGQALIANSPGTIDYLLDRSTESSMEGLVAKYNIIQELADSPTSSLVFRETEYSHILDYKKQGATYAPSIMHVAVEGAE